MGDAAPVGAARKGRLAALAAAAMLALTGCQAEPAPPATEQVTEPIETASAAPAPTFASDEEALAAGVAALEALGRAEIDLVGQPGDPSEAFAAVATGAALAQLEEFHATALANGHTYSGSIVFSEPMFQSSALEGGATKTVFYVCADVSGAVRTNSTGQVLPFANSSGRSYSVATAVGGPGNVKIESFEVWEQAPSC